MIRKVVSLFLLLVMAIALIPKELHAESTIQPVKEEEALVTVLNQSVITDAMLSKDPTSGTMAFDFGGAGTQENPYIITKASDLNDISQAVIAGNDFAGVYFKSVGSVGTINLGNFVPIGTDTKPFRGNFDGDGVIFNVAITRSTNFTGLFGYVDQGTIKNLSVTGTIQGGTNHTGGIVGYLRSGTIENVYNLASVTGTHYLGGIAGYMYFGTIKSSFNNGNVTATGSHAGGITGYTHGSGGSTLITNVYNRGTVLATTNAGGLVGTVYHYYSSDRYNTLSYSYSSGLVSANTGAGGVIGSFTASANTRTHIYYDMSVIALYDQPRTLKPAFVTNANGVKTESMIFSSGIFQSFDSAFWTLRTGNDSTGFYPELKVFAQSTSASVRNYSYLSVQKDISYGMGTANYPFLIKNAFDMTELSRRVNSGNIYTNYHFKVDDGIDEITLSGFTPIGNSSYSFQGVFDGNGVHFNISISNSTLDYQGLFGYMSNVTSEIKNFSISGSITGKNYVGSALAYLHGGTVKNIYNTARVHGNSHVGGIVGHVAGTGGNAVVTNTINHGEITAASNVGGIVGSVYNNYPSDRFSTISYSYSAGQVAGSSASGVGGVIGSYVGTANARTHLYYDITQIVNYDKPANTKPSTNPVTANSIFGITTGQFISDYMESRLTSGYVFTPKDSTYGYYPQLALFHDHALANVKERSIDSVEIEVVNGLGTVDLPFLIRTNQDLEDLKTMINAGNTFLGFYFKVDDGIESFNLGNFTPIGTDTNPFYGSFNGNHAVFELAISRTSNFTGLFGYFGQGKIENLSVTGTVVGGTNHTGGIVGYQHSGTIENVYNLANVTGTNYVGGIVGYILSGDVKIAYNNGNITASGSHAGGIAGYISGSGSSVLITNTYNRGEILATSYAGGLVGYVYHYYSSDRYSTISYSYSSGLVSANTGAGGVIGYFLASAHTRTHIYYDMSVIALYDQPRTLKPAFVSDTMGLKTEDMLFTTGIIKYFNSSIWTVKPTSGSKAYYPALINFADHSRTDIKNDSNLSVEKDFSYGMGTSNYPFLIKNAFDMTELSRRVNKGYIYTNYYFKVDDGIDQIILSDFIPIGNASNPFQGIFEGNGVNFDVSINKASLDYQGLFGFMSHVNSEIKNFSVSGTINGRNHVGSALAYLQGGKVRNIYNTARINGSSSVGGIVGYVAGTVGVALVTNTYNRGEITAASNVGGIVGSVYNNYPADRFSTISYSYSAGQVAGTSGTGVGGVIGSFVGTANTREHLYYDITQIVNYDKPASTKPSTDPVTANQIFGITSGQFISDYLKTRLTTGWSFVDKADGYGYYPQLSIFKEHVEPEVNARSISSVEMFIGDGLGTEDIPFLIRTNQDLEDLKTMINAGNTFLGFYFKVDDGIESFNLGNFTPIGTDTKPFYGSFNGNHAVFELAINRSSNFTGLFGYFGQGKIENLSVTGTVVGGTNYTSGIVGYQHSGTIENVYNLANVTGTHYVGGIVGHILSGTVKESYNNGKIVATGSHAGGIAGYINGSGSSVLITNTYNRGEIIATSYAGGLVGYVYHYYSSDRYSTISYSYSSGLVSANTGAGGVIGYFLASAHTRTHIYYDMSVIALYDQPKTLKPNYITDVYGLDTGIMITKTAPISNFSDIYWSFETKTDETGYYPALKVFSENIIERISTESLDSITIDIAGGMGTQAFPFLIKSEADMFELSRKVAAGNLYTHYYFKVDDGIDELILTDFTPIGNPSFPFEGIFDGNGVNIDLTINKAALDYQGLFGFVRNTKAEIKNFSMSGSITGRNQVGAVVAYLMNGTIKNVYTTARVNGASNVGGIVGYINGSSGAAVVTNTYNRGEITANSNVGGLVGYVYNNYSNDRFSTISYSYSAGQVAGNSGSGVGGVIGSYAGTANTRSHLYYDITQIVNYDKPANTKPSTSPVTANSIFGITSGQFIGDHLANILTTGWTLTPKNTTHGFYPQLSVFSDHDLEAINIRSLDSVKIFIGGGLGTEDLPFLIRTVEDLNTLRSKIEAGNTFQGFHYKVDDGIDSFSLGNFTPIGTDAKPFYGSFDGNHAVFDVAINRSANFTGLFGYFGFGTIKNLSVTGTIKGGTNHTGGVVGYQHSGTIENVYNLADVSGTNYLGGIVGYVLSGTVKQSYNHGKVLATGSHAGGIAGYISGSGSSVLITNTYNRGEIIATSYAGGIVGYTYHYYSSDKFSTVSYSYSAGLVSANTGAGGVIGYFIASANTRTHIYYDATVLINYVQPKTLKPSTVLGGMALSKTDMIDREMTDFGFSESHWEFRSIEGNYAYYPQLSVFSKSSVARIANQSVLSVRTNPFLGNGTQANPFLIRTPQDMINLSKSITSEFDANDIYYLVDQNSHYFNLIDTDFSPIGSETIPFKGHFDGNYATFDVYLEGDDYVGLFGHVGLGSMIKNIAVSGTVIGEKNVGAIAARNQGSIQNVYSTALVNGSNNVGGLVGYLNGSLTYAYQTGAVSGLTNVGGIVGLNEGTIMEVYFSSRLTGQSMIGGIVGLDSGTTSKAYYETTIISYHEHAASEKPTKAIGNKPNTETVMGLDKEYMKGLGILGTNENQLRLSSTEWKEQATSGLYDFYPQLTGFKENIKVAIQQASQISARTIRFASGSGSKLNPYIVRDAQDMLSISEITTQENLYSIYFKVADEVTYIDLSDSSLGFKPIGASRTRPFRGGFDGNNARFNLNLTTNANYQGLFGYLMEGAEIKNLETVGFVNGYSYVGGVSGYAEYATFDNVRNYASITAYNYGGGLIGQSKFVVITNVYNFNSVKTTQHYAGGLIGQSTDTNLSFAFNYGSINGNAYVGGLIGSADSKTFMKNVYNRNQVIGIGNYVGGITGYLNGGTLEQAYNASIVRGGDVSYLGGLIGRVNGTTFEDSSYYDQIIIEADDKATNAKPTRAIGNKLDQDTVKPVLKTNLTGLSNLTLDPSIWTFVANDGVKAFYPQLKAFSDSSNPYVKNDSLVSVESYLFAGNGEVDSPYMITNEYDMKLLASLVNGGISFTDTYFRVRKDAYILNMTLSGLNYTPVGTSLNPFDGIFDGLGTQFKLGLTGANYQGLFGYLSENAIVKNLSVTGTIDSLSYVGSVAGYNQGEINNVYSLAKVKGQNHVGGLVGYNEGILENAYMIGDVEGQQYVGGLIGTNTGSMHDVYSVNQVYGISDIGGITGGETTTGQSSSAYYNSSIVSIFNRGSLQKPTQAIGNKSDTLSVMGTEIERMTSGYLSAEEHAINLDANSYVATKPFGFNLYYPQLKYFQTHAQQVIKDQSLFSVTIDRFTEGDGSIGNPYVIRTAADMKGISDLVGAKNTLKDKYFIVSDDVDEIDLTDPLLGYLPIGNGSYFFQGHFDGNGTVFTLNVSNASYYQGLFGYIGASGVVKNLGVKGSVYGTRFAGGVAGRNDGTIENTYNMAHIVANNYYAGGITGYNSGHISYSFNHGHIKVNTDHYAGGIVGAMARNASISYAYNTGLVEVNGSYAGGIVGYSDGNINQTYNASVVRGNASGAISGRNTSYASTFSSFYDYAVLKFSTLTKVATRGIANIVDNAFVYGVSTSQLASDDIANINLEFPAFQLRLSEGYTGFYPQLTVFSENSKTLVKEDSLSSVSTNIFKGQGNETSPYLILDAFDLKALSTLVLQGVETENISFKVYENKAVIDLDEITTGYRPIGTADHPFDGSFNGHDATINLSKISSLDYQGIFGYTSNLSKIENLNITGSIKGKNYVGSLVAHNLGTIENVISYAHVEGNMMVGGIAGYHDGMMINVAHKGNVKGYQVVGGLVGENNKEIMNSYHMGHMIGEHDMLGGLAGLQSAQGSIYQSFSHGNITTSGNYTGGLVGYNNGSIELSYYTGDILSNGSYAAGITAVNEGSVRDSYAAGKFYSKGNVAGVYIENTGFSEHVYYDQTIITDSRSIIGYQKPSTAIHGILDDQMTKGLIHDDMTGFYSIGTYDFQMKFDGEEWVEKEGYDFVTYFAELLSFHTHVKEEFKNDSLLSITSRKIEGEGTSLNPYLIYDANDMLELKSFIENEYTFVNKYFKVADGIKTIDLTNLDEPFTPIGTSQFYFGGNFDGQGANFVVDFNHPIEEYIGLFHTLAKTAVVKNMDISGTIYGQSYVGAVAGRNLGRIENVRNYATITSIEGNDIGGITGLNEGAIVGSTNYASITMQGTYAGGITGQNIGSIVHSYNKGQIKGHTSIGGITGRNLSTMEYTYNMADVSGQNVIGGIAGDNSGSLTHSFNHGKISASQSAVGGIAGLMNSGTMYVVYNTGHITTPGRLVGGIIGHLNSGSLYDAYHGGSVDGLSDLGTIIGQNIGGTVSRSYYDLTSLAVYITVLNKPVRAIGNQVDTINVKGLHRAQMAGVNSIGQSQTQMNFLNGNSFSKTGSVDKWSFYPQIKGLADSQILYVKEDSLKSVRIQTFILGSGTLLDPYIIQNESDMVALAETTNSGNDYTGIYFKVKNDLHTLDFASQGLTYKYVAIGNGEHPFNGSFDGNGVNIDLNLVENKDYQGLFGYIGPNGEVRNVSVSGRIQANHYVGGIAGYNEGLIENVYNQANISSKDYTGGLVGYHEGTIQNAYNRGEVYGHKHVGGITGFSDSHIKYTYNTGIIYGKSNVGALVGFLNKELITNSYYDTRILGAYRSYDSWIKPEQGLSNSMNSDTVKGLDKNFMTGFEAIGTGTFNMDFTDAISNWTTQVNVGHQNHYPQLAVFSKSTHQTVKNLSKQSTETSLYVISYDYRGATENNTAAASYAIAGYHYKAPVGFKFGYQLTGWYYTNDILENIQVTNGLGESLSPYNFESNITLYSVWEIAEHVVKYVDGNGKVIHQEVVTHGDYITEIELIPEKDPSRTSVFFFDQWNYDFSERVVTDLTITANYIEKDRYYRITYVNGDGEFFSESRVEYGHLAEEINDIPRKTYVDQIAYRFDGWDFDYETVITEHITIEPLFSEVNRYYQVRFLDGNGDVFNEQTIEYLAHALIPSQKPTKLESESHTYTFVSWESNYRNITDNEDILPIFSETIKTFNVTFIDGNGAIYAKQTVSYGDSAAEPVGIPSKLSHDDTAYRFTGWNLSYTSVTEDITVQALYDAIDRYYEVIFYDANDIVISTETVEYLFSATAPSENPTKDQTIQFVYTFETWDQDFSEVPGDMHIRPIFQESLRPYTVTFVDGNGQEFEVQTVLYGENAEMPTSIPAKEAHDQIAYKFVSWSDYTNITSDRTVTSSYTPVDRYYIITFYSFDSSTVLSSQKIEYGNAAIAPEPPIRTHTAINYEYVFTGWTESFDFVESAKNVYPIYVSQLKEFKVTFINGDETVEQMVKYGANAIAPTPYKSPVDQMSYVFAGWDVAFTNVTKELVVTALFTEVYNYYIVEFYNGDQTLLDVQHVTPGQNAIAPFQIPYKEKTDSQVFIFTSWDKTFEEIDQDMKIYSIFNAVNRFYTVNFYDAANLNISTQTVEYGFDAVEPAHPEKAMTEQFNYTFDTWDKAFTTVISNLDVYPIYTETVRTFEVTFYDGNLEVIEIQIIEYGKSAIAPLNATKTHTDDIYYIFSGWNKAFVSVKADLDVYATFNEVDRYYTVNFLSDTDELLDSQRVEYLTSANDPMRLIPVRIIDANTVYAVVGWDQDFSEITSNLDIHAIYQTMQRYYTVRFFDDYGTLLSQETVEYGMSATAPGNLTKVHQNIAYIYVFQGWSEDYTYIESNLNIYPLFESKIKTFKVTFVNGDEETTQDVNYNQAAIAPTPQKTNTAQITYVFNSWDKDFSKVTEDMVITALFDEEYAYYTVRFYGQNNELIDTQMVEYLHAAVNPIKNMPYTVVDDNFIYAITGWDKNFSSITNNLDVYAIYNTINRYQTVKFYDHNHLLISEQAVEYGHEAIAPLAPVKPSTSSHTYTFTGWDQDFTYVHGSLDIYPLYEAILREYVVTFIDGDNQIISVETIGYGLSIVAPSEATKTASTTHFYVFVGWDQPLDFITSDLEVHATYNEVNLYYVVKFYGESGVLLDTQTVMYGHNALDPISSLPFTIVDENSVYTIIGWNHSLNEVKENREIHAIYDTVSRYYTVTFFHENGEIVSEQIVEYGKSAIKPNDPVKPEDEAYVYGFVGWDKSFDFIRNTMSIYAIFEQTNQKFNVIFYDGDGKVYDTQVVYYGENATTPNGIPYKTPTPSSMFVFTGWKESIEFITKHTHVYPLYDEFVRTFVVRFIDQHGQFLKEEVVQYNQSATPPTNYQTPASTDEFMYVPYWSHSYTQVKENLEIKLDFEAVRRMYTYTFLNEDGTVVKTVKAEYGSFITAPVAPEKQMTVKYQYVFVEWGPDYNDILTKDVTYYPYYDELIRTYEVKFMDGNGDVFGTIYVPYGGNGTIPEGIPVKDSTNQYWYEFTMWQVEPISVKRDMEIQALFNRYLQQYEVTFIDENGNILRKQMVEYGTGATEPTEDLIPKKADTREYTYTFAGWSRPFGNVTEDITVQTVYIGALRTYTYTFYDDDQITILKQVKDIYGAKISAPNAPTKANTEYIVYVFTGWDKVVPESLTDNVTFYAVYQETGRSYNVIFYNGSNQILEIQKVTYGQAAETPGQTPTKLSNAMYDYVFIGWQEDYSDIRDNLSVYPLFEAKLRTFNVTFINYDGSQHVIKVEYGMSAQGKVATPYQPGYRFVNWDKDITVITSDLMTQALYLPNDYYINFHGAQADLGSMETIIASYHSHVSIPTNNYSRLGYYFGGWKLDENDEYPVYTNQDTFTLTDEGLDLYAAWVPIVYDIEYELDGGYAVNPANYTIEDTIILQNAQKDEHKFLGWYLQDIILSEEEKEMIDLLNGVTSGDLDKIEMIESGHVGNIVLVALYEYDGYIQLKEQSTLGLYHADIDTTAEIFEREAYDDANPIYLLGVFLGQTLGNIRDNFINTNIEFIDVNGHALTDDQVVATGYQIVIRHSDDENIIRDRIHIVLKGDTDGNGSIDVFDILTLTNHVNNDSLLQVAGLLAGLVDSTNGVDIFDFLALTNHIIGDELIHDPTQTSTMIG